MNDIYSKFAVDITTIFTIHMFWSFGSKKYLIGRLNATENWHLAESHRWRHERINSSSATASSYSSFFNWKTVQLNFFWIIWWNNKKKTHFNLHFIGLWEFFSKKKTFFSCLIFSYDIIPVWYNRMTFHVNEPHIWDIWILKWQIRVLFTK